MQKILNLEDNKKEIRLICEALSSDKRLQLLQLIKNIGQDTSHKELAEELNIRSSSISFHMSHLIDADLVDEEIGKGLRGRLKKVPILKINKIVIEL